MSSQTPNPSPLAPLIVVSGPSGVGKTTVVERLLERKTVPLRRAVTATTRMKRPAESDDQSYHFWTRERFQEAIAAGEMFEWAEVFGIDLYGTPRSEVDPYIGAGTGVVLVLDVQGAAAVRKTNPGSLSVFVRPPSFEVLEARLRGRGDMNEDRIRRRLQTSQLELDRAAEFDHQIVNDDLTRAVDELEQLVRTRFE